MARSDNNLKAVLEDTADAIRSKKGTSEPIIPRDFADEIENLPSGGEDDDFVNTVGRTIVNTTNSNIKIVGSYAFQSCTTLENVSFPNCVKLSINAFAGCKNLENINIPKCIWLETNAFAGCLNLISINIPECVEITGTYAFSNCNKLTGIDLPACITINGGSNFLACRKLSFANIPAVSLISTQVFCDCNILSKVNAYCCNNIYVYAFSNCSSLTELYILEKSTTACNLSNVNAFFGTPMSNSALTGNWGSIYVHPDKVSIYKSATNWVNYSDRITLAPSSILNKGIWTYEFYHDFSLSAIPSEKLDAEVIGQFALNMCSSLTAVSLSKCLAIGGNALANCENLSNVDFNSCKVIGESAFKLCTKLNNVSFPNCYKIMASAFFGCNKLESVSFPNCLYIGSSAFNGCSKLENINFPNCLEILNAAFVACNKLESVSFPNCLYIGSNAFNACNLSLSTINFPNCLEINNSAFYNCSKLENISFPNCLYIGSGAFKECKSLNTCYLFNSSTITKIYDTTFSNCSALTSIYVRASLMSKYLADSYWASLSTKLIGLTDEQINNL